MVDVDKIKDATSSDSLSDKLKEKAKGAAGVVKEKAKEGAGKAKEKVKGKVKEKLEERKRKRKQKEVEERAFLEAKREARIKEASNVGRAEGISEAREMARNGIGGSSIGRAIKGMATKVQIMAEDTGGAFDSENRRTAAFIDTGRVQEKLVGSTMSSDKLDVAPKTDLLSKSNKKMNLLGSKRERKIDFGSSKGPDEFFGKKSSKKSSDMLNFGKKKKKKDFDFY